MFPLRNLLALSLLLTPALTAAQGQPFTLRPGDLVFTDTASNPLMEAAIRVLRPDGRMDTLLEGAPLHYPDGILIDRDGALLISDFVFDGSPDNAIWRLASDTGLVTRISHSALVDNFTLLRDGGGAVVVADGHGGLVRLGPGGQGVRFSPAEVGPSFGLALDYDGTLLLSEPPGDQNHPGRIYRVRADGQRSVYAEDAHRMPAPNDLTLAADGSLFVTNFNFWGPDPLPRLLRVDSNGHTHILAEGGMLKKPKGVTSDALGRVFIADLDDQSILVWEAGKGLERLASDLVDGVDDGVPLDRPFALTVVPDLWLRTPHTMTPGQSAEVVLQGRRRWRGELVLLAASLEMGPTPMAPLWPGSPQSSHLDLAHPRIFTAILPPRGGELHLTAWVPAGIHGLALHLQAILPGAQVLSNHHAVPLR